MPQPMPTPFDWNTFGVILTICSTLLTGFIWVVNSYFKARKEEKTKFIEEIAETAVNKTLDKVFTEQNSKIETLFKYREEDKKRSEDRSEADRKHWDERFDNVIREIKK